MKKFSRDLGRSFGLTAAELAILKKLTTPIKIQDFLDTIPMNFEKKEETYMSPRRVLRENKAHCFEGALLAALALWIQGEEPLLMDLRAVGDEDHIVTLFRQNGYWGAISKTNHAALRFRDPVHKTLREVAISYFHEYFNNATSKKGLRWHSTKPFNLKTLGTNWVTTEDDMYYLVELIDEAPHSLLFPKKNLRYIRKADPMELRAGTIIEWKEDDPRT